MTDDSLRRELRPALIIFAALTVLTGLIYPLVMTGIAQVVFPGQANGSLIYRDGQLVGSALIGQSFHGPEWFQSRPSATGGFPYNGAPSGGSNLGPMHPDLAKAYLDRAAAVRHDNPGIAAIPVDLLTASGSGLDPEISPASALLQVPRIAAARQLTDAAVRDLVNRYIQPRQFGILGEARVNVLLINLALDSLRHVHEVHR